ncbi:arginine--tRNA ligase [Candidatus Dependentiae bacterium]|nr:arginine--tRNA ligase [Candidatus Dependentiae bacterium]
MNTLSQLQTTLHNYLKATYPIDSTALSNLEINLNIDAQKQQFGDITTNAALVLSKELKQQPRAIAQEIQAHFTHQWIERIEIAGPGFINIFLTQDALHHIARQLLQGNQDFFKLEAHAPRYNYNVEFVSANPTGPLHIGHGRGGIIGDVLGNVLHFLGHVVTKEFYINDAGSQIQKLGLSFKIRCQQQGGLTVELPEDTYHGEYLISLAQECIEKHGPEVLERPDSFFATYAKEHLLQQLQDTLKNYGITFDVWFSEKTLHDNSSIEQALDTLQKHGHIYQKDDALWFASTAFGDDKDRVLRKSSGELTYVSADIAYLNNKIGRGFNKLVMVLGQDHHSYVVRLKAAMQALGYNPADLDIILYQLVTLKESGQQLRMSKRAGRIVTLEDVIDTVGVDVARFFYLNRKADAHLDFDIELALKKTEENPVYYIQYAYVRIASILEKAAQQPELTAITAADAVFISDSEKLLLKKIASLASTLTSISRHYQTHTLTYYALELAQLFHSYYGAHKVIDQAHIQQSRGRLLTITILRNTLKLCLDLLGISSPERM